MELGAANSQSWSAREAGAGGRTFVGESDAVERSSQSCGYGYTQLAESRDAVRHQSFTARFIDGGNGAIYYGDSESLPAQSDGRGEARGSASCNTNVDTHKMLTNHRLTAG